MLQSALKSLMATLKDPYSAKLDSQIIVTREEVPVVCGRVNANVAFLDDAARHWSPEQVLKAGKRCGASAADEIMPIPAEYQKYVEQ
jgi:hypothetical protein